MMSQEEWSSNSLSSPSSTGSMDQEWPIDTLTNFYIEALISKTKYPVFTVCSMETGTRYAMKFFPAVKGKVSPFFENEIRFEQCPNKNIISAIKYEYDYEIKLEGQLTRGSYILMEYAPFGNFFHVIKNYHQRMDEKILRTYFHQLINGIEFLHSMGCAHLDLKPENLLLGADFQLKIADFDTSYVFGDPRILAKGTRFKRAPELLGPKDKIVPTAADIFAAGIILFIFKTGGKLPQTEEVMNDGKNLLNMMFRTPEEFWKYHMKNMKKDEYFFDRNFKKLFIGMTKENPRDRFTIDDIKNSYWYNLPIYSDSELAEKMADIINKTQDLEASSPGLVTKSSNFFKDPYDMNSMIAESEIRYFQGPNFSNKQNHISCFLL